MTLSSRTMNAGSVTSSVLLPFFLLVCAYKLFDPMARIRVTWKIYADDVKA